MPRMNRRLRSTDASSRRESDTNAFVHKALDSLTAGLSWNWLVSRAQCIIHLSWPDDEIDDPVSSTILKDLMNWSDPEPMVNVTIPCDLDAFLCDQFASQRLPVLEDVVVICGREDKVQALSCGEYAQQTWPLLGLEVLQTVQKAHNRPEPLRFRTFQYIIHNS